MNKLKLQLDELSVESFATAAPEGGAEGTVHGREFVPYTEQWQCRKTVLTYCPCTPVWAPAEEAR